MNEDKWTDWEIFDTPQKRRCRDCACLVEGDDGAWVCDAIETDIHNIERCVVAPWRIYEKTVQEAESGDPVAMLELAKLYDMGVMSDSEYEGFSGYAEWLRSIFENEKVVSAIHNGDASPKLKDVIIETALCLITTYAYTMRHLNPDIKSRLKTVKELGWLNDPQTGDYYRGVEGVVLD